MNNDNDIPPVKKKRMTAADKKAAYSMLVALSIDQRPPRAAFSAVAAYFDVHRTTTARLWKQIQSKIPNLPSNQDDDDGSDNGDNILLDKHIPPAAFDTNMSTRRKGKFKHDMDDIKAKVAAIPFSKRRRTRMFAAQLEIPQSSLIYIEGEGICIQATLQCPQTQADRRESTSKAAVCTFENQSKHNNTYSAWTTTTQVQHTL